MERNTDQTTDDERQDQNRAWDLTGMSPASLASVHVGKKTEQCKYGEHSAGWYVGYQCSRCGDID